MTGTKSTNMLEQNNQLMKENRELLATSKKFAIGVQELNSQVKAIQAQLDEERAKARENEERAKEQNLIIKQLKEELSAKQTENNQLNEQVHSLAMEESQFTLERTRMAEEYAQKMAQMKEEIISQMDQEKSLDIEEYKRMRKEQEGVINGLNQQIVALQHTLGKTKDEVEVLTVQLEKAQETAPAVRLVDIFDSAQETADKYTQDVMLQADILKIEAESKAKETIDLANVTAAEIVKGTETQCAEVLARAERDAEMIVSDATSEARNIINAALADVDVIKEDAYAVFEEMMYRCYLVTMDARLEKESAETTSTNMLEEANAKAEKIVREANDEADIIIKQAQNYAQLSKDKIARNVEEAKVEYMHLREMIEENRKKLAETSSTFKFEI